MKDRIVPVFEGVWIDIKEGVFVKDCAVCGPGCSKLVTCHPVSLMAYDYAILLAKEITIAAVAQNEDEFRDLSMALLRPDVWLRGTASRWREHVAEWLVRTMGRTRAEVLAFLERIARRELASTGYGLSIPACFAPTVGVGAATGFAYPAILALTDSCAEFNVLVRIAEELGERLERRVEPFCLKRGVSARDVALIHARQILRILRNRHRYVL